ncbi:DUF6879 family protein [Thermobifida alba]|uniref:DUF6879 family protein n=1 Tax=Thermobifida alba TaxID=53522 RepID=UPI003133B32F
MSGPSHGVGFEFERRVMAQSVPAFVDQLAACRRSAVHLEMRDVYAVGDEVDDFEAWKRGHRTDWNDRSTWWHPFYQAVADAVARGVVVRRARVVSEPVSEYIRYEHHITRANVIAGEQVRWLPRRRATDLALPGNDFWLFDDRLVRVNHFSGDGVLLGQEIIDDPAVAKLCTTAFEAVWDRAIPTRTTRSERRIRTARHALVPVVQRPSCTPSCGGAAQGTAAGRRSNRA